MRRRWLACAALAAARSPWEASQDAAQCARLGDAAGACAAAQVGLHGARVARGGAPVFVVGAEHAGTRYAAWLLRQHPAAPPVVHLSFPSAGGWPNLVAMAAERPAVPNSNLQIDFNVSVRDSFDKISSVVLRELDESNRFVQKSAESTSI